MQCSAEQLAILCVNWLLIMQWAMSLVPGMPRLFLVYQSLQHYSAVKLLRSGLGWTICIGL